MKHLIPEITQQKIRLLAMTCARHVWVEFQGSANHYKYNNWTWVLGVHCLSGVCPCLFSPWRIPCVFVCLCLPWHRYNLGNYSANKLGARPNRKSCFLGLIDSLDVLRVWSISVKAHFLTSGCVMRLSQTSFTKKQTAYLRRRAGQDCKSKK